MRTVTILKSRIDDADYDDVLTQIDIVASDLEPGTEEELRVIVKNDIEEQFEDEETETETEVEDEKHG